MPEVAPKAGLQRGYGAMLPKFASLGALVTTDPEGYGSARARQELPQ